jgi:hypothetical protein
VLRTTLSPHRRSRLQLDPFGREGLIRLLVNLQVIFFEIRCFLNSLITETVPPARPRRRFRSSRLIGEFEKPWLEDNKRRPNWDSIIFYTCIGIALGKQLTKLYRAGMLLTLLQSCFGLYLLVCVRRGSQVRGTHSVSPSSLSAFANCLTYTLKWCMVLDEDFATLDTNVWNHEVQLNGFG